MSILVFILNSNTKTFYTVIVQLSVYLEMYMYIIINTFRFWAQQNRIILKILIFFLKHFFSKNVLWSYQEFPFLVTNVLQMVLWRVESKMLFFRPFIWLKYFRFWEKRKSWWFFQLLVLFFSVNTFCVAKVIQLLLYKIRHKWLFEFEFFGKINRTSFPAKKTPKKSW